MTEREKIIDILNKNFTQEVECTPVYTTADGKEIELPQELCDIFNDIVTQAVIPYFADALITAGYGDMSKQSQRYSEKIKRLKATIVRNEQKAQEVIYRRTKCANAAEHRAEVAEKMFNILYEETSEYMKVLSKEWYKYQAKKELAEGKKDE